MLKRKIAKLDDVEEAHRKLYKKVGDVFELDLEADDAEEDDKDEDVKELRRRLSEMRETNVKLMKNLDTEREAWEKEKKKFEGIDPERYKEAEQALQMINAIEEKDLIKGGKFDEVIKRRTAGITQQAEEEKKRLAKERDAAREGEGKFKGSYHQLRLEQTANRVFGKLANIRQGAYDDLMSRVHRTWKVKDDDNIVGEGVFGKDGEALTGEEGMEEWGKKLLKDAAHLFEPASGGGAGGSVKKPGQPGGPKTIRNDPNLIGKRGVLEKVASGEIRVDMNSNGDED